MRSFAFLAPCSVAVLAVVAFLAGCDDGPAAPSGPGNTVIDDSNEDAVARTTQDATVPPPQGVGSDGGYDSSLDSPLKGASTGYQDVTSPSMACASCSCGKNFGYCLENGTSDTVTGATSDAGTCAVAPGPAPAVGCNFLPEKCAANPTCECILNAVQPPVGCYPQCTTSAKLFDVFCTSP